MSNSSSSPFAPDLPIRPASLIMLHDLGFQLVALDENSKPVQSWSNIYDNPDYWTYEKLVDECQHRRFLNVATTLGTTHIKDHKGKNLSLNVLDVDCEEVYRRLCIPINELLNHKSRFSDILLEFLVSSGITNDDCMLMLDIFKAVTYVTKTKKSYGYHIFWLSQEPNPSISSRDCSSGFEFEIKTAKQLCTLPPSKHRDDASFRYQAIGVDTILQSDKLYFIFSELFKDLLRNEEKSKDKCSQTHEVQQDFSNFRFSDLSSNAILKSIDHLFPYYIEGHRNDFALTFAGMAFHFGISEASSGEILKGIADKIQDKEKENRLATLHFTYKKGIEGKPTTGGPTLAEIISINKYHNVTSNQIVNELKNLWKNDIGRKDQQNNDNNNDGEPLELSIPQAIRKKEGFVKVKGAIVGLSTVYNMVKSIDLKCNFCNYNEHTEYSRPLYKAHLKEYTKCPKGSIEHGYGYTAIVTSNYISVLDVEVQDPDRFDDLERLWVKLFEHNTVDIAINEIISITGNLQVIRRNDSSNNKAETVLFTDSIEYTKKQELKLTEIDIIQIQNWKAELEKQGKYTIDELVNLLAPEFIDTDYIKKAALITCANAGIKNIENRLPKRLRINLFLLGDPGLAKTEFLKRITRLIPNSRYTGGQNATGLSLTAHVSKEDGDIYMLRCGPIPRSKGAICAINEFGQLPPVDHKHFLDCMDDDSFPVVKHGFDVLVEAHATIIASANPIGSKWKHPERIETSEIPTSAQILDRFDVIIILRENRNPSYLRRLAQKKREVAENYERWLYLGNEEFLQKYLAYARSIQPKITEQAYHILAEYFARIGEAGIDGLQRKFDTLLRISIAIAKLELKEVVEEDEVRETMEFYNMMLQDYKQLIPIIAKNPRDVTYDELVQVIKQHNGYPILLSEAAKKVRLKNEQVKYFLGDKLELSKNHKLRDVLELLRRNESIEITSEMPITLRWKGLSSSWGQQDNNTIEQLKVEKNLDKKFETTPPTITSSSTVTVDNATALMPAVNVKDDTRTIVHQNDEYDMYDEEDKEQNQLQQNPIQEIVQNNKSDESNTKPILEELVTNLDSQSYTSHTSSCTQNITEIPSSGFDRQRSDKGIMKLEHSTHATIITNDDVENEEAEIESVNSKNSQQQQ